MQYELFQNGPCRIQNGSAVLASYICSLHILYSAKAQSYNSLLHQLEVASDRLPSNRLQ